MIPPFDASLLHTFAELRRIDLLIQPQRRRARQPHITATASPGLRLTEEADAQLSAPAGSPRLAACEVPPYSSELDTARDRMRSVIAHRREASGYFPRSVKHFIAADVIMRDHENRLIDLGICDAKPREP
jgi:hypothetical protein